MGLSNSIKRQSPCLGWIRHFSKSSTWSGPLEFSLTNNYLAYKAIDVRSTLGRLNSWSSMSISVLRRLYHSEAALIAFGCWPVL